MAGELIIKNGLIVSGSTNILGSIIATSFTGSYSGSITNATSASFASTASYWKPTGLTTTVTILGNPPPNNLNFVDGILVSVT